ncbi:hypothetical protein [Pseudomonas sp. SCB32]|uniref:hypothetical protein n=1 Tax=Pseudomonas sp. SCB32 TaxID=2653853 RepID=UPI001264E28F|nr:hypothetical protein [Pseudomonas sp. SCB32]
MGIRIVVKGADFSERAVSYIPAVEDGLEYLNFFGGSADNLRRNLAKGKPDALLVGAPVVKAHSAVFTNLVNYLKTAVDHTPSMSIVLVLKTPATEDDAMYVSNFGSQRKGAPAGTTTLGTTTWFRGLGPVDGKGKLGQIVSYVEGATNPAVEPLEIDVPTNTIRMMASSFHTPTRQAKFVDKTAGYSDSRTLPVDRTFDLGQTFNIGSTVGPYAPSTTAEIYFAALYSRQLSDAELDAVYQSLKAYYTHRGIVI